MAVSVSNIIRIAKVSQYLSKIDVAKGSLFGKRIAPNTPQILYMERKAVEWLFDLDPTNETLTGTANYLYSLCRGYNLQAQNITGSGTVAPINPIVAPNPYDFIVDGSSFVATGATTKNFPATWAGYNLLFVRNGIPQSTQDTGGSYYSWDRAIAVLTISPAAQAGEQFQFYPV